MKIESIRLKNFKAFRDAKEMLQGVLHRILPDEIFIRYVIFQGKQDLEKNLANICEKAGGLFDLVHFKQWWTHNDLYVPTISPTVVGAPLAGARTYPYHHRRFHYGHPQGVPLRRL